MTSKTRKQYAEVTLIEWWDVSSRVNKFESLMYYVRQVDYSSLLARVHDSIQPSEQFWIILGHFISAWSTVGLYMVQTSLFSSPSLVRTNFIRDFTTVKSGVFRKKRFRPWVAWDPILASHAYRGLFYVTKIDRSTRRQFCMRLNRPTSRPMVLKYQTHSYTPTVSCEIFYGRPM